MSPREVELPICEECGHIGKMPAGIYGNKTWCLGPNADRHKKVAKRLYRFVEVGPVEADA